MMQMSDFMRAVLSELRGIRWALFLILVALVFFGGRAQAEPAPEVTIDGQVYELADWVVLETGDLLAVYQPEGEPQPTESPYCRADFNGDGYIGGEDFYYFREAFYANPACGVR